MTIIVMENCGAAIIGASADEVSIVSDTLSYDDEDPARKAGLHAGQWNSKKTFLREGNMFESGFVQLVKLALNEKGYAVTIQDNRNALDALGPEVNLNLPTSTDEDGFLRYGGYLDGIEMHDFQAQAIETFVIEKRGIIQAATGAGKTEIACGIIKRIARKALFLTHKLDLVGQTRKRIKNRLGVTTGMISEGEWMPADVTVATVQTIMAHFKRDPQMVMDYLRSIELLIVDEAHRSSGNSFFNIISNCVNAYFRASLTATPLMKGKREDDLRLIATSGNIICRIPNGELIRRGILAQPYFIFSEVPHFGFDERAIRRKAKAAAAAKGKMYGSGVVYQEAYRTGIVENLTRNYMILADAREMVAKGRKVVVLFTRQEHGKLLYELFKSAWVKCRLVYGEDDVATREDVKRALREGEIDVMIASTILDEGIDEPCISGIILAGGGKSKISLFQRVGRSVRKKHGDELDRLGNTAEIRDYIDVGSAHLHKHSAIRFKAVKDEDGWIIDAIRPWTGQAA